VVGNLYITGERERKGRNIRIRRLRDHQERPKRKLNGMKAQAQKRKTKTTFPHPRHDKVLRKGKDRCQESIGFRQTSMREIERERLVRNKKPSKTNCG